MNHYPKFGPDAQTSAQRTQVLHRMRSALPSLRTNETAYACQLYDRYIAGELSWLEVHSALDTTAGTKARR